MLNDGRLKVLRSAISGAFPERNRPPDGHEPESNALKDSDEQCRFFRGCVQKVQETLPESSVGAVTVSFG
jgi:hypothetical protein